MRLCFTACVIIVAPLCCAQSTWQSAEIFPHAAARTWAAGVQRSNGQILAVGGAPFAGSAQDGSVHFLQSGAWAAGAALDGPIIGQGAGVDSLGRLIVYSGYNPSGGDRGADRPYDLTEGYSGDIAQRDENWPHHLTACASDGLARLYAIGGNNGNGAAIAHSDRYDAQTDSWTVLAPPTTPVVDGAAVFDGNGAILVIGGLTHSSGGSRVANVARYDIATNTWSDSAIADLPVATSGLRAVRGSNGRIYAIGGDDGTTTANVWVLDLASNTWSPGPSMATPRKHFGAVLDTVNTRILVMGGENDSGGTNTCETLYTPLCPTFSSPLPNVIAWIGGGLSLGAEATGGLPMTFRWQFNGIDLSDGTLADGSVVAGATTSSVLVTGVTAQTAGSYRCIATNACGQTTSSESVVTTRSLAQGTWRFVDLDFGYQWGSNATGVDGNTQVGSGYVPSPHPNYIYLSSAMEWHDTTPGSLVYAPQSVGGGFYKVANDWKVGWWWKPFQVWVGGQWQTAYYQTACVYTPTGFFDRAVPGYEYSIATCTDGVSIGGQGSFDDNSGNYYNTAVYWDGPNASNIHYLSPGPNRSGASVSAIEGTHKFGSVWSSGVNYDGHHAVKWTGTTISPTSMEPAGVTGSGIASSRGGEQAGSITVGGQSHACIWRGTSASARDLHPFGATSSSLAGTSQGIQTGNVDNHASLWLGSPHVAYDLQNVLPATYVSSFASDIHVNGDGSIRVVGSAMPAGGPIHAMLWIFEPGNGGPVCDSIDFNNDTSMFDPQDIDAFLSVYSEGPCIPETATCNDIDFNNDGSLFDPCDIDSFLLAFSEGPCTLCGQ